MKSSPWQGDDDKARESSSLGSDVVACLELSVARASSSDSVWRACSSSPSAFGRAKSTPRAYARRVHPSRTRRDRSRASAPITLENAPMLSRSSSSKATHATFRSTLGGGHFGSRVQVVATHEGSMFRATDRMACQGGSTAWSEDFRSSPEPEGSPRDGVLEEQSEREGEMR